MIYLPPGPTIGGTTPPSLEAFTLPVNLIPRDTTLVKINYRLGSLSPISPAEFAVFPTPIHEVATAFDYLTSSTSQFNENEQEGPKICLMGTHIGGALAAMLALTEPNAIHALSMHEPMLDWVGLDEVLEQLQTAETRSAALPKKTQAQRQAQKQAQRGRKTGQLGMDNNSVLAAVEELIKLRSKLFKTPSAYFDPFASPMLFLRAPGRDTPTGTAGDQIISNMGHDDVDGEYDDPDAFGPYDDDWQQPSSLSMPHAPSSKNGTGVFGIKTSESPIHTPELPPRRRKVLRRWPAVEDPDSVTLPHVKIFVQAPFLPVSEGQPDSSNADVAEGHSALMRAQGSEMVELLRRACFIGREKSHAEERVKLELCGMNQPLGDAGHVDVAAIKWLGEMFTNKDEKNK